MRLGLSFAALFLSVFLVQIGSGALGPLDALSGAASGFSATEIGFLGSAHFFGFFIGCWLTPRLLGRIGHSRTFAVLAAVGAIGALAHPMWINPWFWAVLRVGGGLAVAGGYTVIESWLQAKLENAERGRVTSGYRMVDLAGALAAQLLIGVLPPAEYVSYNLVAMTCCLCLLPLALTTAKPPMQTTSPRLRPLKVFALSPVAVAGVVTVGLTNSSFRMVGPLFGETSGLSRGQISLFLAAAVLGGAVAQPVVGWLADRYDRRTVMIGVSFAALGCCAFMVGGPGSAQALYLASLLFGAAAFPLFSIAAAHANDYADQDFYVELNAGLLFWFGVGAIVSPLAASALLAAFGPAALFGYIAAAHVGLILFSLYRMARRGRPAKGAPYAYVPRTSYLVGRLMKRRRD